MLKIRFPSHLTHKHIHSVGSVVLGMSPSYVTFLEKVLWNYSIALSSLEHNFQPLLVYGTLTKY